MMPKELILSQDFKIACISAFPQEQRIHLLHNFKISASRI